MRYKSSQNFLNQLAGWNRGLRALIERTFFEFRRVGCCTDAHLEKPIIQVNTIHFDPNIRKSDQWQEDNVKALLCSADALEFTIDKECSKKRE